MKKNIHIVVGADHRGFQHKAHLITHFNSNNFIISWIDVGAFDDTRSDYPEFAIAACYQFLKQNADYGILLCATGIGMAIAANRFPSIYAGVAWNKEIAQSCKEDDNVNVLVLPADFIDYDQMDTMVDCWLNAEFKHDRYKKRLEMIDSISHS